MTGHDVMGIETRTLAGPRPSRRGRARRGLAVSLLLALVATACSNSSTDLVVMADFSFTPAVIQLPADTGGVTLMIDNVAGQPHDFTVEGLPDDVLVHLLLFEYTEGAEAVPYVLPELPAGVYDVYCSLPGHREAGMTATLVVS